MAEPCADETERYVWRDRWTGNILETPGYPASWDELNTEEYKPTIISCNVEPDADRREGR